MLISQNTCEASFLFPLAALSSRPRLHSRTQKRSKGSMSQGVLHVRTRVRGTEAHCTSKCIRLIHAFANNVKVSFSFEMQNDCVLRISSLNQAELRFSCPSLLRILGRF